MRRFIALTITFFSIWTTTASAGPPEAKPLSDYFPPIEPFHTGFLKVSALHEIYYEESGDPSGVPVFVLHGGPGGGSYPELRRFHDPKKYHIVTYDQRGAGKSKPHCELKENDTPSLVEDIEKLRHHLKLEKIHLFGGSWGSTLALAYAEKYPRNVSSLVIRGIFLGTKGEIDHFYHGAVGVYFPEVYEKFRSVIPHPNRLDYPRQLLDMMTGKDEALRKRIIRAWAEYESKVGALEVSDEEIKKMLDSWDPASFSLIENHYMANRCFLNEGQLMRHAGKLAGIPTVIVHGRYDVICAPRIAYELHKAIRGSRLVIVEAAGHGGGAPPMRSALIEAVRSLEPDSKMK
jgi:proline iminopeptidase